MTLWRAARSSGESAHPRGSRERSAELLRSPIVGIGRGHGISIYRQGYLGRWGLVSRPRRNLYLARRRPPDALAGLDPPPANGNAGSLGTLTPLALHRDPNALRILGPPGTDCFRPPRRGARSSREHLGGVPLRGLPRLPLRRNGRSCHRRRYRRCHARPGPFEINEPSWARQGDALVRPCSSSPIRQRRPDAPLR